MKECPHGDDPLLCPPCISQTTRIAPRTTGPRAIVAGSMTALYAGTCPSCGEEIQPGDHILRAETEGWVHEDCG